MSDKYFLKYLKYKKKYLELLKNNKQMLTQSGGVQQPNVQQPNVPQTNVPQTNVQQPNVPQTNVPQTNVQQPNVVLNTPEISPEQTEVTVDEIEIKNTYKGNLTLKEANNIERVMDGLICNYGNQVNNNEGKNYCGTEKDGKSTPENIIKWYVHIINNDPDRKINFETVNKKINNQQMSDVDKNIYEKIKSKVINKFNLTKDIIPNRVLDLLKKDLESFHKNVLEYSKFHNLKLTDNEIKLKLFTK